MKRGLIYLVLFLLSINIALADVSLDDFDRNRYNLGDKITFTGNVVFDNAIIGSMKVDLKCDEETATPVYFSLLDLGAEEAYGFSVDVPTRSSLMGECNFILTIDDGIKPIEETSKDVEITDELNADASTDVITVDPGDVVVISGGATKLNGEIIENGEASIITENDVKLVDLSDGTFEYIMQLPLDIKSDKHEVSFEVRDLEGNKGSDVVSFKVNAVPTKLELDVGDVYAPGVDINGKVRLIDQAGDLIGDTLVVEAFNPSGGIEYSQAINTEDFKVTLSDFSTPGSWRVDAKSNTLFSTKVFTVSEVKEVEMWLEGTTLYVRNIGNIDYMEPIEVQLDGATEVVVVKETSIKPNQTIEINLNEEVGYSGEYGINVPGSDITGNVVLEGNRVVGSAYMGWIALMFVFVFFIFMVLRKGKKLISGKKGVKEVREKGKEVIERTETKDDEIKQEDIDHLVGKVKKENPVAGDDKPKDNSGNQSMFKIFD